MQKMIWSPKLATFLRSGEDGDGMESGRNNARDRGNEGSEKLTDLEFPVPWRRRCSARVVVMVEVETGDGSRIGMTLVVWDATVQKIKAFSSLGTLRSEEVGKSSEPLFSRSPSKFGLLQFKIWLLGFWRNEEEEEDWIFFGWNPQKIEARIASESEGRDKECGRIKQIEDWA